MDTPLITKLRQWLGDSRYRYFRGAKGDYGKKLRYEYDRAWTTIEGCWNCAVLVLTY